MNAQRFERGQALVLILLSIVAIFGFAALAVDFGRIYAERRRAQSASDSAALAAAYAAADTKLTERRDIVPLLEQAALAALADNGFLDPHPNVPGDEPDVAINTPPTHGDYEECDCQYIQVNITTKLDPVFAQFVFQGDEKITTEAIARGRRNPYLSENNAIHALSEDTDAVEFDGTTGLVLKGGNVYSNGGGLKNGSSGIISVTGGKIKIADNWVCNGSGCATKVKATVQQGVGAENILDIPSPYCPAANETHDGVNYYVHNGINGSMRLEKGIHCVNGDIVLNGNDVLTGSGVLLVMKNGGITINGNAKINLKRPQAIEDKNSHSYNGMLIYAPRENTSTIQLGGTADSWFSGTIFATSATCDVGGTSATNALHTAVICDKVKFHGTSDIKIIYKDTENFQMQPVVELIE